jgi:hypothetical protein
VSEPGGDVRRRRTIKPSLTLLLCEHATVADDKLFISGAGDNVAPPPGRDWYLAGVMDIRVRDLMQGGTVKLHAIDPPPGYRVPRIGGIVSYGSDQDPEPDPDYLESMGRSNICLRLPRLPADLLPGMYQWRVTFPGMGQSLPFIVRGAEDGNEDLAPQ